MDLILLKEERIKRGITQERVAKKLGFKDKSSYCLIEKGRTSISVDMAKQIVDYFHLSEDVAYKIFLASEVQETST